MWSREMQNAVCRPGRQLPMCTDQGQSFAIVLWGWLRSHMPEYNGQKGELFAIEEVGKLLYSK